MDKVKYIDPTIGNMGDKTDRPNAVGGGKTHPGAVLPGGMVQLSPDTVTAGDDGSGYNYIHKTIEGFSFNHMSGIGWYGDLGNIQIMPVVGKTDLRSGSNAEVKFTKGTRGWKSEFLHDNEKKSAGYYSVLLERYNILAEATATMRTGVLRFTYPESDEAGIIFNFSRRIAGHADYEEIKIVDDTHIEGHIKCTPKGGGFGRGGGGIKYDLYFFMELSKAPKSLRFFEFEESAAKKLTAYEGEDVGLLAYFDTKANEQITLKCGISYVDIDGARKNFEAEKTGFDDAVAAAKAAWALALDIIDVEGDDETDLTVFHTCMYHALLDPRTTMDVDGRFRTANGNILTADYTHRTMFSGWDVYRSEFPLLTLIHPEMVNDTVNSLLNIALDSGTSLPRWELMGVDSHCMVGDPGLLVAADAYLKGIKNYDIEKLYGVLKASALISDEFDGKKFNSIRPYSEAYIKDAYVPKSLSQTLEYLLADYTLAKLAEKLGKREDAEFFMARAMRYAENYDSESGFMGTRDNEGKFISSKTDRYDSTGCVESNIYQQSWFVPYDVQGLAKLFGEERTVELLEELFERSDFKALWNDDYNHSNEPCHNITHYFNHLGLPRRTQYWTRRVQKEAYGLGAYGFCGNEDVGQLSGWYVLSALGFAQICPGEMRFDLNTPLFRKATVKLNKKYHSCAVADTLVIECDKDPNEYPYISEVYLNGTKLDRLYVNYEELTTGGKLMFELEK